MVPLRILVDMLLGLAGCLRLDALLERRRETRVVFQAYSVHLAQFYKTIVAELLRGPDAVCVEFMVLPHPHFSLRSAFELRDFARDELGIDPHRVRFYWQAIWRRFDVAIYSDVYARFPPRAARNCLIAHGPGLRRRFFERRRFRKTVADFDAVLVNGPYDHELVESHLGPSGRRPRVRSTGLPILDSLAVVAGSKGEYLARLDLAVNRKTVLFAPHWETLARIGPDGQRYVDDVIRALKTLDVNVVLKLHACSLNPVMAGSVDWRAKLVELSGDARVGIDMDVDDLPAVEHADVLVTDVSSRAFTFMLLEKPAISYCPIDYESDELDASRMALLREGALVAGSAEEVRQLVEKLNGQAYGNPRSLEVSRRCFASYGQSTAEVVAVIREELTRSVRDAQSAAWTRESDGASDR